jgi:hypothetical protein
VDSSFHKIVSASRRTAGVIDHQHRIGIGIGIAAPGWPVA